ncbi:MAG: hypothetical protein ACP5HH_04970 [Fervidicoccaceae archaeon]
MEKGILLNKLTRAEEALRKVVVPGYNIDVISSGIVSKLRISNDGRKLAVYLNFSSKEPACLFRRFISDTVWSTIAENIRDTLVNISLFDEFLVLDDSSESLLIQLE